MNKNENLAKKLFGFSFLFGTNSWINLSVSALIATLSYNHFNSLWGLLLGFIPLVGLALAGNGVSHYMFKQLNQYVNFQKIHPLDDVVEFNNREDNLKAFIKHSFLCFLTSLKEPSSTYEQPLNNETQHPDKKIHSSNTMSFLDGIWQQVKDNPNYQKFFLEIYEEFKNDGLLGYSIAYKKEVIFQFISHGLNGDINLNEYDLKYFKKHIQRTYNPQDNFSCLFEKECYINLPIKVREYLLARIPEEQLKTLKSQLNEFEKEIQNNQKESITNNLEKIRQQKNQEKRLQDIKANVGNNEQNTPKVHSIHSLVKELDGDNLLDEDLQNKLNLILDKTQYLTENYDKLKPENSVEFKALIETILPKYLQIIAKNKLNVEKKVELNKTLTLIENFMASCLDDIKNFQDDEFDTYDEFLKKKFNKFNQMQIMNDDALKHDKKLSM
jgi:hypothetical protein